MVDRNAPKVPEIARNSTKWLEVIGILLILGLGLFFRLYQLNTLPYGTWFDEAQNGQVAEKILAGEDFPVYAPITNLPANYIYLIVLAFKFFGVSTLSMRYASVFLGTATLLAAYFLGRELGGVRLAMLSGFLMAVSRWDVNWSRIAMHGVSVPLFALLSTALLLYSLRKNSLLAYAITGISIGLGFCFYTPLRIFPVLLVAFLIVLWIQDHSLMKRIWPGLLVLCLGCIIVAMPIGQYTIRHWSEVFSRTQQVSVFSNKTIVESIKSILENTRRHLLMFNFHGDNNGRHNIPGAPMFNPICAALFVLGLGICLTRIRQTKYLLVIAGFAVMILPGILSLDWEAPQSLRAIGTLPFALIMAAIVIDGVWQEWGTAVQGKWQKLGWLFLIPRSSIYRGI